MYGWEGRPFDDIAALAARRDPRRYPMGCLTGGRSGGDGRHVLQWFRHVGEMTAFLIRMEPQRWGVSLANLIELKSRTGEILTIADVEGPTEPVRIAHNAVTAPAFEILWWGSWDALLSGGEGWPGETLEAFAGRRDAALPDGRIEAFLAFLRQRYGG